MKLEYINKFKKYENVKQVLKEEFELSDNLIVKLKHSNQIFLNSIPASVRSTININDIISVSINFEETSENIVPTNMTLNILYEDDCFLVLNKPPFMPIHPSINHFEDSLSNVVKFYFNKINLNRKIRPINRLDKNTSGITIFAKNEYVQECLIKQMKNGQFKKEYLAFINGSIVQKNITITAPIARKNDSIIERCVNENGDFAQTIVETIRIFDKYSLVKCILKTGRTHQIRVHLSYIGNSILGDDLYGTSSNLINRQALHAHKIQFIHPITKKTINISADLPQDMHNLLEQI